jgi:hypothetical protein
MTWAVRATDGFRELRGPSGTFFGACARCGGTWPYPVTGFYRSNVECFDALADHVARVHDEGEYVGRPPPVEGDESPGSA